MLCWRGGESGWHDEGDRVWEYEGGKRGRNAIKGDVARDKNILTSLPWDSVLRIELPQQNKCPNHRLKTNLSTIKITISFPPWIRVYSGTFYSVLVIQTTHTRLGSLLPFTYAHTYTLHTYIYTHINTYIHTRIHTRTYLSKNPGSSFVLQNRAKVGGRAFTWLSNGRISCWSWSWSREGFEMLRLVFCCSNGTELHHRVW